MSDSIFVVTNVKPGPRVDPLFVKLFSSSFVSQDPSFKKNQKLADGIVQEVAYSKQGTTVRCISRSGMVWENSSVDLPGPIDDIRSIIATLEGSTLTISSTSNRDMRMVLDKVDSEEAIPKIAESVFFSADHFQHEQTEHEKLVIKLQNELKAAKQMVDSQSPSLNAWDQTIPADQAGIGGMVPSPKRRKRGRLPMRGRGISLVTGKRKSKPKGSKLGDD